MFDEVIDYNLLLGILLPLVADSDVQAHDQRTHQASLEGVPQELGRVARDPLQNVLRK